MTAPAPGPGTINNAYDSVVGMQANEIHNSNLYQVLHDAPPEKKFQVGITYLKDGVPSRARDFIQEARANGLDTAEVRFHLVLALLSKRSYRDLPSSDRELLADLAGASTDFPIDAWATGLRAVLDLLDRLAEPGRDPGAAVEDIHSLPAAQREKVLRHLDLVLTGSIRATFWAETCRKAEETQFAGGRRDRVWAYFQPKPREARARHPEPTAATTRDRVRAAIGTLAACVAIGWLGRITLAASQPTVIFAYLITIAAGASAGHAGLECRYRFQRLTAKERQYRSRRVNGTASDSGFAGRVDQYFTYYFTKYAPRKTSLKEWLDETSGFRSSLRNELVDIYREKRVSAENIKWLIRYSVRDVRTRWLQGMLFDYRDRYRIRPALKMRCVGSAIVLLTGGTYVVAAAVQYELFLDAVAAVVAITATWIATASWSRILNERRRVKEGRADHRELMDARNAEHARWTKKLDDTRPDETSMEAWLDADKTIALDKALTHYRLAWSDVLAHTFLQTPAKNCARGRVVDGPPRYSKYDVRLFLITRDGVREVNTEIDFARNRPGGERRTNFRFDAVSSVHVAVSVDLSCALELTLMNGTPHNIDVTNPATEQAAPGEDLQALASMSLDTTGFAHALHILEGIAAEGKEWIIRDPYINS